MEVEIKNIIVICVLGIIAAWYVVCMLFRKNHYMYCGPIIKKQIKLFKKNNEIKAIEIINFFVLPFIIALILFFYDIRIDKDMAETVLVIMSILLSSFFTLMSLVLTVKVPIDANMKLTAKQHNDLNELFEATTNALNFEILISIIIILLNFFMIFMEKIHSIDVVQLICSFLDFYFILVMVLNLFVVLREFFALISHFMSKKNGQGNS